MSLTVRPIRPTDFDQWSPLWEGYNSFYERVVPEAVTRMTWSRFFAVHEPVHALTAEAEGRLVGIVHYLFHRSTSMIEPTCYLQDLFASPEARGQGVGRALIEGVYEAARAAGSTRVYWLTHETNATAMQLYDRVAERTGFVQYRKAL